MKSTSVSLFLALFVTLITSCSNCEDDGINVDNVAIQYRINIDEPIIAEVQYKNAAGELISEKIAGQTIHWFRTEFIDEKFLAYKKVKFYNVSSGPVNYTLRLFVDGNMIQKKEGSISPESEVTDELQYSVLD
ncbi:hypothetical protein GR160_07645 [Flavobacterium sp. Sd200]|uniref:hypothetical protein n=1 Tax=Flavobacterium sp. Sd200 TaxID=2692211 RepID=UPI00136C3F57|nr:hypothetical protein [Flavobacterium sp. Sd200]MXN91101.1 hypothetical protein [Flavobacterium sp. Sd200]